MSASGFMNNMAAFNLSVSPSSLVDETSTGPGGQLTGHQYAYFIDFNVTPTFTLTGDLGWYDDDDGSFSIISNTAPGTFVFDTSTGVFTYTLTVAEAAAHTVSAGISILGTGINGSQDADSFRFLFQNLCFAQGTGIATPDGETAVEDLRIGDLVRTVDGRNVAVKWVGVQTASFMFNPAERLAPVRIHAGAFGENTPNKDLVVTADHGMIIDDMIINASALVNGDTVVWDDWKRYGESLTYYHVETEEHDVILAHGAASETFLDMPDRRSFDNLDEYVALYGEETQIGEAAMPRISSARLVPDHIKAQLRGKTAA